MYLDKEPDTRNLTIQIRWVSRVSLVNLTLIIFFLAATSCVHLIETSKGNDSIFSRNATASYLLSLFNLSSENTLASWFSSMLLLQTAIIVLLCYWLDRSFGDQSIYKFGWGFISLFFFALSLDELGSIHENAGELSGLDVVGDGGWQSVIALPLLAVLIYMGMFAFKHLRHHRSSLSFLLLSIVLIVTIPFHEYFEMKSWSKTNYSPDWERPILFVLLEEGAELFAFFFFLKGVELFLRDRAGINGYVSVPLTRVKSFFYGISVAFSLLFILLYYSTEALSADEGISINWFPATLAFIIAAFLSKIVKWYVPTLFLITSAFFGTNFYALMQWSEIQLLAWVTAAILIIGFITWIGEFWMLVSSTLSRLLCVGSVIAIISAVFIPSPEISFVAFTGLVVHLCDSALKVYQSEQ